MSEQPTIRVVRRGETSRDTPQTSGVIRFAAIAASTVGSQRIWLGPTIAPPGLVSGVHHHGDSESAIYQLRGHATFVGEGLRQRVDIHPGDFYWVPPNCVHVEANLTDEDAEFIVARSTREPIVVNLEDVEPPHDLIDQARAELRALRKQR